MLDRLRQWFGKPQPKEDAPPSPQEEGTPAPDSAEQKEQRMKQCFADLGLSPGADLKTVRRAWKEQLARYHRDLYSENPEAKQKATQITFRLNEAYRFLQKELF